MSAYRLPPLAGRSPQADDEERVPPLAGGSLVQGLQAAATNANEGQFGGPAPAREDDEASPSPADGPIVGAIHAGASSLTQGQFANAHQTAMRRAQQEADYDQQQAHMDREAARQQAEIEARRDREFSDFVVRVPRVG